ncbi:hypothetical protein AGRA3207_000989 [Actinomadura graeca]|uniref:Uncharacterized protein n=1 Tax=Actinomadura graeca TaxID=2750812 RepID=A0ABX8QNE2_9ACTN|nr:hypothetical protein [Actinomadura graeca]QXJ20300.1 hypothetical protein AGRA3207_000989 [Actinomadura graeca]
MRRNKGMVTAVAVAAGVPALMSGLAGTAGAATAGEPRAHIKKYTGPELMRARRHVDRLQRSETEAQAKVQEHLDDAARNGRLVDQKQLQITSVPDPFASGEKITVVWEGRSAPEEVLYSRKEHSSGSGYNTAMGIQLGGGDTSGLPEERVPGKSPAEGSAGYDAVFKHTDNTYLANNACSTGWFKPHYDSERDHKIVSCFEKYALRNTPVWYYNRWTLWTPAPTPFGIKAETVDMEVSARPWKGREANVKQLADWVPRAPKDKCDTKTEFTLSGGVPGISGSVTMPINTCENYWLNVSAGEGTQNRMTIDFDGKRTNQMYMDIAGKYDAKDKNVVIDLADRNYVQLSYCTLTLCRQETWEKADSGW